LLRGLVLLGGIVTVGGASGCSGGAPVRTALSVGDVAIGQAAVAHWARAISAGEGSGGPLGQLHGSARERALEFLISARWLIGEAAGRGQAASDDTVERKLRDRIEAVPNGEAEFEKEISSLGRTGADVKLEIEAELAAAKLSQMVARHVPAVTPAEVAGYYRNHQAQFRVPDLRTIDLIEAIRTRAGAIALGRRTGPGKRFAAKALHELVRKQTPYEEAHRDNGALVHAIFAAKLGTVAGPVRFHHAWALVVVRKVVPARIKPLAAVREEIAKRLASERRALARQSFIAAYRRKWIARTDCRPGFVVQKCSQYRGRLLPEPDPLSFRTY
jgi:foldase protein PrsA